MHCMGKSLLEDSVMIDGCDGNFSLIEDLYQMYNLKLLFFSDCLS